jgi:hypothetical protein
VRNDSLLYDEPLTTESGQSIPRGPPVRKEHARKQPRFVPDRNLRSQIQQSEKEFQKIPEERGSPEAYSEMALDGSEDDDPELVSFSQRQASRSRISDATRNQCRNRMDLSQMNQDFPSPMSISSPSTASKDMAFFPDAGNSDNGSADSVWSGYSPDFLAPDAQYETIPEHRLRHENANGSSKIASPSKHRGFENQDWHGFQDQDSLRFIQNINSPRANERKILHERARNEVNSPKERRSEKPESAEHSSSENFDMEDPNQRPHYEEPDEVINSNPSKFSPKKYCGPEIMGSPVLRFDRCGNLSNRYYDEHSEMFEVPAYNFERKSSDNEMLHSPKHHYEQIRENTSSQQQHYEEFDNNPEDKVQNSPKIFDNRFGNRRNSPDSIGLADGSECCHNDSTCRCYLDVSNSAHPPETIKSVDI